ncbi:hypothetical protein DFH11DRAFT_702667 [Phellopilus nigrolimitatus]|nr:hypothetical protein DFH11DRAFT_702667 [Phellopilus nigrolimitatus]
MMSTMATFREIVAVKKQMESHVADSRELKHFNHRLAELRGAHASGLNSDILAQIISWLPLPNLAYPSNTDAPLNVSQVCRTWRYSAVSNSALWTKLYFYAQKDPLFNEQILLGHPEAIRPRIEASVKAWAIWLARSRSSPLLIRFDPKFIRWSSDEYKEMDKLLAMTLSHQRRWKHIDIGFPPKYHDMMFTMRDLPLLETLSISVKAGWRTPVEGECLYLDLSYSPRLRELRMFDVCCLHDPAPTFGKLNKLTIRNRNGLLFGPTWRDFIQIARFAPQLQFIEKLMLYVDEVRDTTEVVLPMVREASFKLTELQPRTLSHALSQLTMPNLESLDIAVCRTANASNLCFGIKSLLLRSKCSLTSLSLWFSSAWHPGSDDTVHLADLLSTIPELRHLSLKINNLDNAFLHALAIIPGSADFEPEHNLCPGLESISVAECQSLESFFQMVASRWRAGRTLRKVFVDDIYLRYVSYRTRSMINGFVSEGLVIQSNRLHLGGCNSPLENHDSSSEDDD